MTTSAFTFDDRLRIANDVLMQDVLPGESAFVNLDSERYFGLDRVGTRMWKKLTAADTIGSAYEALLSEFEVEPERLRKDLSDLIAALLEHGLARIEGTGRSPQVDE